MADLDRAEHMALRLRTLAQRLESPHADKVFVAKDFTKADVVRALRNIAGNAEVG